MLSLGCQDDQGVEDKEGVRKKKRKKAEEEDRWQQELEEGIETLPILGGFSVALVVGAPVYLAANIKLAMFAAIGGGIMGYTTGKMFSDWGWVLDTILGLSERTGIFKREAGESL